MSTFNYHENKNWNQNKKDKTIFFERFAIETSLNTRLWSFLPQINWNMSYCEIELRWLCAAIRFRNNEKFYHKSTRNIGRLKGDYYSDLYE